MDVVGHDDGRSQLDVRKMVRDLAANNGQQLTRPAKDAPPPMIVPNNALR